MIINFQRKKASEAEVKAGIPEVFPRLWRFCVVLCGEQDQANDLAQSTCLRALEKHQHFTPGTHLDRWLFVMARRVWLNEKRKETAFSKHGLVSVDEVDIPDNNSSPEMNILASEVLSKLMALPEAQRVTATLVYVEGYTYREASELLEIPIGTVMSRLSVARKKLAEDFDVSNQGYVT